MIILIQNLPENVTKEDISKFVTPALKKLGIIRLGNIQKIDTLSVVNKDSRSVQYASLVRINTEMPIQIIIDVSFGECALVCYILNERSSFFQQTKCWWV